MVLSSFTYVNSLACILSANLQSRVKKGVMTQEKYQKTLARLTGVLDYECFKDVDLVIEASFLCDLPISFILLPLLNLLPFLTSLLRLMAGGN